MCNKTIWNTVAKLVQEKYFNEYGRSFDPFKDIIFDAARKARDTKRKQLQTVPENRKRSSSALTIEEHHAMCNQWDEDTPKGLQRKFFHIAAVELAWRGGEAAACVVDYFKEELDNSGSFTGRLEYNTVFSKTFQGGTHFKIFFFHFYCMLIFLGNQRCATSKWLITNHENSNLCPVRLFKKMILKRGSNITIEKLFLTVNGKWKEGKNCPWYKNLPVGINTLSKWTKISAEKIGLDTKRLKITNHSNRATRL